MWVTARNSSQTYCLGCNFFYLNLFCLQVFFWPTMYQIWPGQGSVKNSTSPETEEVWGETVGMHPDAQAHAKFSTLLIFCFSCSFQ